MAKRTTHLAVADRIVDRFCKVLCLPSREPSKRDTPILGHVDVPLVCHVLNLLWRHTCRTHARSARSCGIWCRQRYRMYMVRSQSETAVFRVLADMHTLSWTRYNKRGEMRRAGETEHANLRQDESPVLLRVEGLELIVQQLPDALDAARHHLHLRLPVIKHAAIVHHLCHDACAVHWRVGVRSTRNALQL